MGTANVTVTPPLEDFERRLENMEQKAPGIINRELSVMAEHGLAILVQEAPKRTGTYTSRFYYDLTEAHSLTEGTHTMVRYHLPEPLTTWLTQGTGIFGPRGEVIRPKRAKALHFFTHGQEVFAAWVRGMPPNLFLDRAMERIRTETGIAAQKMGSKIVGFLGGKGT